MASNPPDQLLTAKDAAHYINVNLQTLYSWRHRGAGPRALKAGRKLRYRRRDIDAWLEEGASEQPHPGAGPLHTHHYR